MDNFGGLQKCTPDYLKLSEVSTLRTFSSRKWTGRFRCSELWRGNTNVDFIIVVNVVVITLSSPPPAYAYNMNNTTAYLIKFRYNILMDKYNK